MTEAVLDRGVGFSPSSDRLVAGSGEPGPVAPDERIQLLDMLRGFALFGILQVNWLDYDKVFNFLIDGSFYTMFSFLFGLGFAIQLLRAQASERPFVARYLWRTTLLFAIGCAHLVFIWRGDIVRIYGIVAVVLLLVRRWPRWALIALAASFLTFATTASSFLPPRGESLLRRPDPSTADVRFAESQRTTLHAVANNALYLHAERDGTSWADEVRARATILGEELRGLDLRWLRSQSDIICMFILGLIIGRMRVLEDPLSHMRLLKWACAVGLIIGVVGNTFDTFDTGIDIGPFDGAAYSLGNIGLCVFYVSTIIMLVTKRPAAHRFFAPLAYVGRMGLTNYLMQSVCLTILLQQIGFGLADRVPGRAGFLMLDAFFIVQILYSRWWLSRFRFGPVEWAWRSLTWGRLQQMRVNRPAAA